jgi:6-phosphogluconolactonase
VAAPVTSDMARGAVIRLASTPAGVASAVASEVLAVLEGAIAWRGEAHLALSGGRTPAALHRVLASLPFDGWPHVHVWFGDERMVPPAHADSNYRMARETLLATLPVPEVQVHRWEAELTPAAAASRYDAALRELAGRQGRTTPAFDLLLLGMGADAHTASLFPGSPLLSAANEAGAASPFATAVEVPNLNGWRLTVTPATIRAARTVFVLVVGEDKHAALRRVLGESPELMAAPATLLHDVPGDLAWYVDRAALFGSAAVMP